jgi:transposase
MKKVEFEQLISVGCGIDVHKDLVVATIRKNTVDFETRSFDAFTSSLIELRDWCKSQDVTHIAMESTGIYWKPLFNVLEEDFEIILVNARHIKNVPGHKTDKKDSVWISKLLLSGLLFHSASCYQRVERFSALQKEKNTIHCCREKQND